MSTNRRVTAGPPRDRGPEPGRERGGTRAPRAAIPANTPAQPCRLATAGERLSPRGHFQMPLIHDGNLDSATTNTPNGSVDMAQRTRSNAPTRRHMTGPRYRSRSLSDGNHPRPNPDGGRRGSRTPDLQHVKLALFQLS